MTMEMGFPQWEWESHGNLTGSVGPHEPAFKWHIDRFVRFCTARLGAKPTHCAIDRHVAAISHPKTLKPNFSPLQPEINVMQTTPYFKNVSAFPCLYYMHAVQEYLLVTGLMACTVLLTVKNKIRLWLGNGKGEQWKWTSMGTGMTPIPIGKIPTNFFEICAPWCKSNITDVTFWRMTAEIFCLIFKVSWLLFL